MWEYEYRAETSADRGALCRRWADVASWARWNDGVERAEVDGVVVTTDHRLEPLPGGRTGVVYRTTITGPSADAVGPELGPEITADFPDVVAALIREAGG